MTHDQLLEHFDHHKRDKNGNDWVRCPVASHGDMTKTTPGRQSLRISRGDKRSFFKCWAGDSEEDILRAIGLNKNDIWYESRENKESPAIKKKIAKTFDYPDESEQLLFQVVRYYPKGFAQRRPDGNGGWIYNLEGVRRIPYRLPKLLKDKAAGLPAIIVEGEQCADALQKFIGDKASVATNSGGAGCWTMECTAALQGFNEIIILPDNDPPGQAHAQKIATELAPICKSVKMLDLKGVPSKGDIVDWIAQGHSAEDFWQLVKTSTLPWVAASKGLALVKMADLLTQPEEQTPFLVERLLPSGWLSGLFSKPKVGKSTFSRHLALAVARGDNFLGRATTQGPVVYVSLEEKQSAIKKHFIAMGATSKDDIYIFAGSASEGFVDKVIETVREKQPVLIIIDTLVRATKIKDVNDYARATEALNPLLALAHTSNCHVMFLHHAGKGKPSGGGDAVLGSTAIFGSTDVSIFIVKEDNTRYIWTEGRLDDELSKTILTFDKESKTVGLGDTKEARELAEMGKAIREFLDGRDPSQEKEIHESVEGRHGLKVAALREEVRCGRIFKEGKGGKVDPFRYSLPRPNNNIQNNNPSTTGDDQPQNILVPEVPIYTPEQREQEPINKEKPNGTNTYSCSQDSACSEKIEQILEQQSWLCSICQSDRFWVCEDGRQVCQICHPRPATKERDDD